MNHAQFNTSPNLNLLIQYNTKLSLESNCTVKCNKLSLEVVILGEIEIKHKILICEKYETISATSVAYHGDPRHTSSNN